MKRYSPELGRPDVTPYAMMIPDESGKYYKTDDVDKVITTQRGQLRQLATEIVNAHEIMLLEGCTPQRYDGGPCLCPACELSWSILKERG